MGQGKNDFNNNMKYCICLSLCLCPLIYTEDLTVCTLTILKISKKTNPAAHWNPSKFSAQNSFSITSSKLFPGNWNIVKLEIMTAKIIFWISLIFEDGRKFIPFGYRCWYTKNTMLGVESAWLCVCVLGGGYTLVKMLTILVGPLTIIIWDEGWMRAIKLKVTCHC